MILENSLTIFFKYPSRSYFNLKTLRTFLIKFFGFFILLASGTAAYAQNKEIQVSGTLIEEKGDLPVPYATVVLYKTDSREIIMGTTTDGDGEFKLSSPTPDFYVEISFMGFKTKTINDFTIDNNRLNLGTVELSEDSQALQEVVITGEVSTTVFKLDKRVFNVGSDISSTGVSALEVLNNVPSVNVDIEGQISLRGSGGVQILINGKPSVLADGSSNALGTITADMIESIEVITNPSAKYDASGTAGILNIILKKEDEKGWNGSVSVNTGYPANHNAGLSLNRRTNKFNLFTQLGAGYRSMPGESESINRNLTNGEVIHSFGESFRDESFFNITLGTDYHINDLNVITLSGNFAYEMEEQPSTTRFRFADTAGEPGSSWFRNEETEGTNPKWQYDLNYSKQFKNHEDHTLIISTLGSFFGKDQSSKFFNTTIYGVNDNNDQLTKTKFQRADYTIKADYTNPLTDRITLEAGAQYEMNDVGNDYEVRNLIDGVFEINPDLTNNFDYDQKVLGAYATAAYEKDKWGVQGGLRVENTDLKTLLTNTNESNSQNFTDFFPSLHTSYKVSDGLSFQAGYSRRIMRPRLWDLNPFFNITNNYSIRMGNPDLQSEYTDSYELTSIYRIGKASLSSSVYYKYTTDVIERVTRFDDNVSISTPQNIGTNGAVGFETNGKFSPLSWLTLNGDFNFNYFNRIGNFEGQSFDFSGDQWSSKLGAKLMLPADIDLEITGQYQSKYKTIQGEVSGYAFMDIGVRKKILKGKAVVNLAVRDLFESRKFERHVFQPTFETYDRFQRDRVITFGVSYAFGKGEAMTYSGGRRR